MSFSFEATGKPAAVRQYIEKVHAPGSVKAFVLAAVENLTAEKPATETAPAMLPLVTGDDLIYVKANGHMYDGPGSYSETTATNRRPPDQGPGLGIQSRPLGSKPKGGKGAKG